MASSPKRVADVLFRRDMLGPSFGNLAGSVVGLLLIEKLCMEHVVPLAAPTMEALEAAFGRQLHFCLLSFVISTIGFWGVGGLLALPALLRVEKWKIQVNKSLDTKALWRALPLITLNFFLGTILGSSALCLLLPESSFDLRQLPSTSTLACHAVVWLLLEEVLFFYVHRGLHENKKLYATIHKIHHTWTAPISWVSIYCHPVEHIVSNIAPVIAGPILCGSHSAAVGVYFFLGSVHTCAVHCGYWVCDDNGLHDEHHRQFNVNYGVTGFMDAWYGTFQLPPGAANPAGPSSSTPPKSDKRL